MTQRFRPSINIIRDQEAAFDYLPTPNAERVFRIIADNFLAGNRAFSILETYGTGKSSFLLALERHLCGKATYFSSSWTDAPLFTFHKVVGQFSSSIGAVAQALDLSQADEGYILSALTAGQPELCRVLVIDEFGKFLEYAAKNDPERELYFIQQLAEAAAQPDNNLLLIVTLHQSFDAYARSLGDAQRNEWEKVRGRLTEIAFNEPVEQLLYEKLADAFRSLDNIVDFTKIEVVSEGEEVFELEINANREDYARQKFRSNLDKGKPEHATAKARL